MVSCPNWSHRPIDTMGESAQLERQGEFEWDWAGSRSPDCFSWPAPLADIPSPCGCRTQIGPSETPPQTSFSRRDWLFRWAESLPRGSSARALRGCHAINQPRIPTNAREVTRLMGPNRPRAMLRRQLIRSNWPPRLGALQRHRQRRRLSRVGD